jgi:hypothetical protein
MGSPVRSSGGRSPGNPDVQKAREEFDRARKVEEKFDGVDHQGSRGSALVEVNTFLSSRSGLR